MSEDETTHGQRVKLQRLERQAGALRENLHRRKAQARARRDLERDAGKENAAPMPIDGVPSEQQSEG